MSRFLIFILITIFCLGGLVILDVTHGISIWIFVTHFLLFLSMLVLGVTNMKYQMFVKSLISANTLEKKIAFTFDDGPSPNTDKVLDLLKKYDARGTFFCIGKHIEQHPEILKRIDREGHMIGNHTYSHGNLINLKSAANMSREILDTEQLVFDLIHKKPLTFRPPYGVTNPALAQAISTTGYTVIGWNIRTFDTVKNYNEQSIEHLLSKISPGSVLLLHDTIENSLWLLEKLLQFVKSQDYQCVSIDELFKIEAYE